jgi:transcriptional regulator with GAF, ATPase, and Fis domain
MCGPRGQPVAGRCSALLKICWKLTVQPAKGAFKAPSQQRVPVEQAHNGTLFLDEIGELPLDLQAKLLRVLQEREFQRLGSSETVKVDVRVIAASNVDLEERVRQGRFRADLYYRLNVVPIVMPPLRRRTTDIPILVSHFIDKFCRLEQMPSSRWRETLNRLLLFLARQLRQLENAVQMAVMLAANASCSIPAIFPAGQPGHPVFLRFLPTVDSGRWPGFPSRP